jgi:hypothetical protein
MAVTIASGLSATKAGFELVKSLREVLRKDEIDPHEVSNRLMELQELMLDARSALADAQDEKAKLEARIAELTRMADIGQRFEHKEGMYWYERFPYCPTCWDVDRKPVRLAGPVRNEKDKVWNIWTCPYHKTAFHLLYNLQSSLWPDKNTRDTA